MTKLYKAPLPRNEASREEVATFWDTHNFAEYAIKLKPVQVHFGRKFIQPITLRFNCEMLQTRAKKQTKRGLQSP